MDDLEVMNMRPNAFYVFVALGIFVLVTPIAGASYACITLPREHIETISCGAGYVDIYKEYTCSGVEYSMCSYHNCIGGYKDINEIHKFCHLEDFSTFGPSGEVWIVGILDIIHHYACLFFNYC